MCQEFNKYWIQNQKSAYEMIKEFVDWEENKLKEDNNMEDRNKTVAELIADLQNQLDRANNRIEGLIAENNELRNKYDKEREKHQRATEKITRLKEESNVQRDKIDYLDDELIAEKVKNNSLKKMIESLQKQLVQKKNEYAELYDELKYDEKLLKFERKYELHN